MRRVAAAYATGGAAWSCYAVWASLLPFDFRDTPLEVVRTRLLTEWYADPHWWSTTDQIANLLLFLPIGLLWSATVDHTRAARWTAFLVLPAAIGLSLALEFAQGFVAWRTPSLLDVLLQAAGAVVGVRLWHRRRRDLDAAAARVVAHWRDATPTHRALYAYALAVACAWLFPFDFTLRPGEIRDKYDHHRLIVPFQPSPDAASRSTQVVVFATSIPGGIAAAVWGRQRHRYRSFGAAVAIGAAALTGLTAAQVTVFSRTTDGTLLVVAVSGAALGSAAAIAFGRMGL